MGITALGQLSWKQHIITQGWAVDVSKVVQVEQKMEASTYLNVSIDELVW